MEKLIIIRDLDGMRSLSEYLRDKDIITLDTETTGVSSDSEIIGASFCAESDVGYYVVTAEWDVTNQKLVYLPTKDAMPEFLRELVGKSLVMHNGVFDCSMVWNNYKVSLIESLHTDTMIMAHLLDENRRVGLKELGAAYYGASAKKEQDEMKESVHRNGGSMTKDLYELYKADSELIAKYGAKDAILTFNIFFEMSPQLFEEGLDQFFYEDESMPLLRGPTYDLNTTGLKVDPKRLAELKKSLEYETLELKNFIYKEIAEYIEEKYPASNAKTTFNIGSGPQLAWLLFDKLGNTYPKLSDAGKELCKKLEIRNPYDVAAKRYVIEVLKSRQDEIWRTKEEKVWDPKARRYKGQAKIKEYWNYLSTDKAVLGAFAKKYKWVEKLLEYKRLTKMLNTYVEGIEACSQYGVIRPSFLQHGTTSGRYSCRKPNFQNLPRDDKRVKACIISRPGKVFVGADYAQLEPRVFASFSGDERLLKCFKDGEDFYSVIGVEVFEKYGCSLNKDDKNSFAKLHPELRQIAKVVALSATYGTTAYKMAPAIGKTPEEAQDVINDYFEKFPSVKELMLTAHNEAKTKGQVSNLFGRLRRMPKAIEIAEAYGNTAHKDLPYEARNILNLAINHTIQSTGASAMNRAAIAFCNNCKMLQDTDPAWKEVKIVTQIHDELVAECPESIAEDVVLVLKDAMEHAVDLPGVDLIAEPKIAKDLASLK